MAQRNFKPQHSVAGKKYSKTSVIMSNVLLAAGSLMIVFFARLFILQPRQIRFAG